MTMEAGRPEGEGPCDLVEQVKSVIHVGKKST